VAKEIIEQRSPRLSPDMVIVLHLDPDGAHKLKQWGSETGIAVVPILTTDTDDSELARSIRRQLTVELLAADPFLVTGPVREDRDFFGRRESAADFLNQLRAGRIRSIFGIRKIGKTSVLNRIVDMARRAGEPLVAMVDCSAKSFHALHATEALDVLAGTVQQCTRQGYASVSDSARIAKSTLPDLLRTLAAVTTRKPLAVMFDEVDYITPASSAAHWRTEFNDFWREFRVFVQEAQRNGLVISVLVSGVSSKYFREATLAGVENSAMHFVPDEYLAPFDRRASSSMISEVARRCGLHFDDATRDNIADVCGHMPFWIRVAGSYLHRNIDLSLRPLHVSRALADELLSNFVKSDGLDLVLVALEHLRRVYPEVVALLKDCVDKGGLPQTEGNLLVRYGLAAQTGAMVVVRSDLVRLGITQLRTEPSSESRAAVEQPPPQLVLSTTEWAEELTFIGRRRNVLERTLRQLLPFILRYKVGRKDWPDVIRSSLPRERRDQLSGATGSGLMEKLFWLELQSIVVKNWTYFESVFGDRARFESAMNIINDRPDAHAKDIDGADIALYRRELTWLEERAGG
jgi:hypothetical protein